MRGAPLRIAGHDMNGFRANRQGVAKRLLNRTHRVMLAPGKCAQAHLASSNIAPPRVQAKHDKPRLIERRFHPLWGNFVRPMTFNSFKACRFRRTYCVGQLKL